MKGVPTLSDLRDTVEINDPAVILLYEAESPAGFLVRLTVERRFDSDRWRQLWRSVVELITETNGMLDVWAQYDLTRIITTVQDYGLALAGQSYEGMDEFEKQILAANLFIKDMMTAL